MARHETKSNCIGQALYAQGLAPDGYYPPKYLDAFLRDVPLKDAKIAVGSVCGVVCHAVPFSVRGMERTVHRRRSGDRIKWHDTFERAIGYLIPKFTKGARTLAVIRYMAPREGVNLRTWRE